MTRGPLPRDVLGLLDEVRALAQQGLGFATDPFDRERYERLLALAGGQYAAIAGLEPGAVLDRFRREIGNITPKLGVDVAMFDRDGHVLLMRRHDDGLWSLPAGWVEVTERPEDAVRREVREELRMEVEVGALLGVFTRLPGDYGEPHTVVSLLYHATVVAGEPHRTEEALEFGFFEPSVIKDWHKDHGIMAAAAVRWWRARAGLAS